MQQPPSQGGEAGGPRPDAPFATTPSSTPQPPSSESTTDELRSDARHLAHKAADRIHGEVDARKGEAATQAKSVSTALDRAAGELDQGSPEWLKSAFRQGAEQVQRFADAIDRKDSRQLLDDVQSFARERPGAFLAACAAAGFAAARVLKAGGERQPDRQGSEPETAFRDQPAFGTARPEPSFEPSRPGEFV